MDDLNPFGMGPAGLFAQFAQGLGGGIGHRMRGPPARAYDEYFKAYSVAMLPGNTRENVSYGGKIIMPPSALASLTQMDLESPWMFKLRNPANSAASTHAGVLEFIAEEGCVNLPAWMMKTLRLEEGDPIRVTGAELPKGKLVKLQAQSTIFLEISDPKAVLEQALRHFSVLTQGDIIEISYNSIVFGLLVMETQPGNEGISVLDTDLEVDFAPPVGYVEPERPKPAAPSTLAAKLNIDPNAQTPTSSRPSSSLGGSFAAQARGQTLKKGGDHWEAFKGKGETLAGRKTKGKGISHRGVEEVPENSKIIRTDQNRVVTSELLESDISAPAPLNLPFGTLWFGYNIPPYIAPESKNAGSEQPHSFAGSGNSLTGGSQPQSQSSKGKEKETTSSASWGSGGRTLGSRAPSAPRLGAGGVALPRPPQRNGQNPRPRSPSPEYVEEDDDEEMFDYDSD